VRPTVWRGWGAEQQVPATNSDGSVVGDPNAQPSNADKPILLVKMRRGQVCW
jgi:hypothetical protein